jgi:hypothetical protein
MNLSSRLSKCRGYACIFSLVKEAVESVMNRRRAGLSLGLSRLPNNIGAFYQVGSNFIVLNRNLVEEVSKTEDSELINSYIFHVLLHEYIHTLGFVDEKETYVITQQISEKVLGPEHIATRIASQGIGAVFSSMGLSPKEGASDGIDVIDTFEVENLNYFG